MEQDEVLFVGGISSCCLMYLPHFLLQYNEKLEIISLNLNTLKTEEETIRTQKMALIRERNLHVCLW